MSAARFGLYVHFPYCLSKCPYCDFASAVAHVVPEERYTQAILAELEQRAPTPARRVDSVFFGGGTPSLWSPRYLGRVMERICARFSLAADAEVTLEANPGAADAARFSAFRSLGINRLSIGVQSFEASTLTALGRSHDAAMAERAYAAARSAGFDNVSMDFIYGVHGQTVEQVERDARRAVALEPDHLSAYALTLDKDSLAEEVPLARQLSRGELVLPSDEVAVQMGARIGEVYGAAGLVRYEISNYARPGYHSRHNCLYWTGGEYLALGTGATGYLSTSGTAGLRYANLRSPEQYLAAVESARLPEASTEPLGADELFEERVAMGLRLSSGIDLEAVCAHFDRPYEPRRVELERMLSQGLARRDGPRIALTSRGADLHSAICARLM